MNEIQEWFRLWMTNSDLTNYIIAFQLPIVLSLIIVSYQYYEIELKEAKFISVAWGINLVYLIYLIYSNHFNLEVKEKAFIRTFLDLATMYFFLIAVMSSMSNGVIRKVKQLKHFYLLIFILLLGVIKNVKIFFPSIPDYSFRFFPAAIFDCFVIVLLALYFRRISTGLKRGKLLFGVTLFYALIQLLSLTHVFETNENIFPFNIDNVGFFLGLLCKTFLLIILTIILPTINKRMVIEEKEYLLNKFAKGSQDILDIKNKLSISLELRENLILKNTLSAILEYNNGYLGYYSKYNEQRKSLNIQFTSSSYNSLKKGLTYSKGLTITAAESKIHKLENDLTKKTDYVRFNKNQDFKQNDINVKSALAVPVIIDNHTLGVFMFENEKKNGFAELDINFILSLIIQTQFAIENNRLLQENELHKVFFSSLSQIDEEIVTSLEENRNDVLSLILNKALLIGKCKIGSILILEEDELVCIQATKPSAVNLRHHIDKCLSGKAIKEKSTKYFENVNSKPNRHLFQNELGDSIKSEFVVPLAVNNKIIGVFNTESERLDGFSKVNREKIEGFAKQTSIVIYVANLLEDIKEKSRKLENSIDKGTIETTILLSNNISHRIGTSIGTVRFKAGQLLKERYGTFNERIKSEIEIIKACAIEALKIDEEITKAAADSLFSQPEIVDFKAVKNLIENNNEFRSDKYQIDIKNFDSLKPIFVDSNLFIDGVLLELIRNSKKSMPKGGIITIKGEINSDYNIISVTDYGCGIAPDKLSKIYNKEYTDWELEYGTGQGLYELKNILELYKGYVLEESAINVGTTFKVYIPFIKT